MVEAEREHGVARLEEARGRRPCSPGRPRAAGRSRGRRRRAPSPGRSRAARARRRSRSRRSSGGRDSPPRTCSSGPSRRPRARRPREVLGRDQLDLAALALELAPEERGDVRVVLGEPAGPQALELLGRDCHGGMLTRSHAYSAASGDAVGREPDVAAAVESHAVASEAAEHDVGRAVAGERRSRSRARRGRGRGPRRGRGSRCPGRRRGCRPARARRPCRRRRGRRSRRGGTSRRGGPARSSRRSCSGAGAHARRAGARRCRTSRCRRWPCRRRSSRRRGIAYRASGLEPGETERDAARGSPPAGARRRPSDGRARRRGRTRPRPGSRARRRDVHADRRPRERDPGRARGADDGSARRAEHDVGALRRPRRALGDEARVVLGARREPGDRLGDGDGTTPRARPCTTVVRVPYAVVGPSSNHQLVARPTGSTLPVRVTRVPGDLRRPVVASGPALVGSCASARRSCRRRSARRCGSGSASPAAGPSSVGRRRACASRAPVSAVRLPSAARRAVLEPRDRAAAPRVDDRRSARAEEIVMASTPRRSRRTGPDPCGSDRSAPRVVPMSFAATTRKWYVDARA